MRPPGSYKLFSRNRTIGTPLESFARWQGRTQRIIDSLRAQISGAAPGATLRIREVFRTPRQIFRVELDIPEFGCQRTTLLDRDALEELLDLEEVQTLLRDSPEADLLPS